MSCKYDKTERVHHLDPMSLKCHGKKQQHDNHCLNQTGYLCYMDQIVKTFISCRTVSGYS